VVSRLTPRRRQLRLPLNRRAAVAAMTRPPTVDLMPRSETQRRERDALLRRWGWGLVAALAGILALSAGAYTMTLAADQRHAAAQTRTAELLAQLATLQDVRRALSTESELTAFRSDAMAADLRWQGVFDTLASALPEGVTLTGFDLTVGGMPVEEEDRAATPGLEGSLTLASPTAIDITPAVRAMRALPGVLSADARDVTSETGEGAARTYVYGLTVTFDQSVYSDAYAPAADGDPAADDAVAESEPAG